MKTHNPFNRLRKNNKGLVQAILGVVISLMVIAVGVFVFYIFTDEIQDQVSDQVGNFTVANASLDQNCQLDYTPQDIDSVRQFNGTGWVTVTTAQYNRTGRLVVVNASALENGGGAGNTTAFIRIVYDRAGDNQLTQVESTGSQGFNLMLAAVLISIAMALIIIVIGGIGRTGLGGTGFM